jgi:PKHD-type hydroxylase
MQLPQMLLHVPGLLSPDLLAKTDELLPLLEFTDGKATATGPARQVKNNLQASKAAHEAHPEMQQLIAMAITSHPMVQNAIMPVKILPPLVSKYEPVCITAGTRIAR